MNSMMEYRGYHATVEYDAEDKIFVGKVFGIVDSLNFHGTSVEELEEMFHQSIENYLSICEQFGKEPDKEFKGTFNVRISPELHRLVALEAADQKITLNQYISRALERSFEDPKTIETIVYMPYSTKSVFWGTDNFISNPNMYEDKLNFNKRSEFTYVGN